MPILISLLLSSLMSCTQSPCDGAPVTDWPGPWAFVRDPPLEKDGQVCEGAPDFVVRHAVTDTSAEAVVERWQAWVNRKGWKLERRFEGAREWDGRSSRLAWERGDQLLIVSMDRVSGGDAGGYVQVRLEDGEGQRPGPMSDPERERVNEASFRMQAVVLAVSERPKRLPRCTSTLLEGRSLSPPPPLVFSYPRLDALGRGKELSPLLLADPSSCDGAMRELLHPSDAQAASQRACAEQLMASELVLAFDLSVDGVKLPRADMVDGELKSFKPGRLAGEVLVVDPAAREVICKVPAQASNSREFDIEIGQDLELSLFREVQRNLWSAQIEAVQKATPKLGAGLSGEQR